MELPDTAANLCDSTQSQDPITPLTLAPVSAKRDNMTDGEHIDLDNSLLEDFENERANGQDPKWYLLLRCIAVEDSRLITLKRDDAINLIEKNPPLEDLLKKTWKEGNFKAIRRLGLCVHVYFVTSQLIDKRSSLAKTGKKIQSLSVVVFI